MEATINNARNEEEEKLRTFIHDIRNPLSSIYLTIDSLRHAHEDNEDPKFYIDLIEKAAKKIEEILNNYPKKG